MLLDAFFYTFLQTRFLQEHERENNICQASLHAYARKANINVSDVDGISRRRKRRRHTSSRLDWDKYSILLQHVVLGTGHVTSVIFNWRYF